MLPCIEQGRRKWANRPGMSGPLDLLALALLLRETTVTALWGGGSVMRERDSSLDHTVSSLPKSAVQPVKDDW